MAENIFENVTTQEEFVAAIESLPPEERAQVWNNYPEAQQIMRENNWRVVSFSSADPSRETTQADVDQMYGKIYQKLSDAKTRAEAEGKSLIVAVGEVHNDRTALTEGLIVLQAASDLGIKIDMQEVSNEGFDRRSGHLTGLDEELDFIKSTVNGQEEYYVKNPDALTETHPDSYLAGKSRHNRMVQESTALQLGMEVFPNDPNHFNWTRGNKEGYLTSREPQMRDSVLAQARRGDVVSIWGAAHLKQMHEYFNSPEYGEGIEAVFINTVHNGEIVNPDYVVPEEGNTPEKRQEQQEFFDEYAVRYDFLADAAKDGRLTHFILPGKGIDNQAQAYEMAVAARTNWQNNRQQEQSQDLKFPSEQEREQSRQQEQGVAPETVENLEASLGELSPQSGVQQGGIRAR